MKIPFLSLTFMTILLGILVHHSHSTEIQPPKVPPILQQKSQKLPILPTGYQSPRFHGLPQVIHSAHDLTLLFDSTSSTLKDLRRTKKANPFIFKNLPKDLKTLPVKEKTDNFIALITPHIIEVNSDVLRVRMVVDSLRTILKQGKTITPEEKEWLSFLATELRLSSPNPDSLYNRINTIPVALMVAQAINESGWGTSRFAVDGNALFGQHAARNGNLSYITSHSGTAHVAAFDDLYLCMAGYILNINRNKSYRYLRTLRSNLERQGRPITGTVLAQGLINYSERGQEYVDELRGIIRHYGLEELNECVIDTTKQLNYYQFTR